MSAVEITAAIGEAVRKSYPPAEYALFYEVASGTGGNAGTYADAVAMSLWPSRGLGITGFEFKASRSDWLREKCKPTKSEPIQRYCNAWILVTAKGVVLDPSEIPEAWGWMELVGGRLMTRKKAPKLEPEALTRQFIAALLRRAGQVTEASITLRVNAGIDAMRERLTQEAKNRHELAREANTRATEKLEKFKEASGIDLTSWNFDAATVGAAFKAFYDLREAAGGYNNFLNAARQLARAAELATTAHTELCAIGAGTTKEPA